MPLQILFFSCRLNIISFHFTNPEVFYMEIERKFLIRKDDLPQDLASYPCHRIEQGIFALPLSSASAGRMMTIFLLTNPRVS